MRRPTAAKPRILTMAKIKLGAGTLLAPLPAVLVTCGDSENANIITIAWTGILCTKPPVMYISVRPERYSYGIIKEKGEFAVNLTTSAMVRQTDLCGVKTGASGDKFKMSGLHKTDSFMISAPIIEESPLSLECRVRKIIPMGTHDIITADILCADADERYIDSKGKLNLQQSGIMAYSHGEYFSLGKKLGSFGFTVAKKKHGKKTYGVKGAKHK